MACAKLQTSEISDAIQTLCPKNIDEAAVFCAKVRAALNTAKLDIIGRDVTPAGYEKFKNYTDKEENPYAWYAVELMYKLLSNIHDYEIKADDELSDLDKEIRSLSYIKHFEDIISGIETSVEYCRVKPYSGLMKKGSCGVSEDLKDLYPQDVDNCIAPELQYGYTNLKDQSTTLPKSPYELGEFGKKVKDIIE